eukprot:GHVS01071500.1.p2 GENE.GHVS01071500.1~~GHVS01071500.1.p2  ORF type:complete len:100 (+),score=25.55 GHVS01071500.1:591-890(+)
MHRVVGLGFASSSSSSSSCVVVVAASDNDDDDLVGCRVTPDEPMLPNGGYALMLTVDNPSQARSVDDLHGWEVTTVRMYVLCTYTLLRTTMDYYVHTTM